MTLTFSASPPAKTAAARVLVVEDDRRIAAFLDRALTQQGYAVEVAGDGTVALTTAERQAPDLVVLDVTLPGIDGLQVARRLREAGPVPILMLTARDSVADRVDGLDAGADDYLVKPFALDELLARLRALLRRRATDAAAVRKGVLEFGDVRLDQDSRSATRGTRRLELRNKEMELLACFLRNPERVLSRREIFEEVWGSDFLGDSNVIEVTVGHLRQKLEAGGAPRLIHTVRPVGYTLHATADDVARSA
jgi:two-component system, OmpR family, response regulator MprA